MVQRGMDAYVVAAHLLVLIELGALLVDTGAVVGGITAESDVQVLEEAVATGEERFRLVGVGINTRLTVEDNDTVCKVGGHDEIVLDDESGLLGVHDEPLDDAGGNDTLLGVEVGRRLINEVNVSGHAECEHNGDSLKFTTGQVLDLLIDKVVQLQRLDDIRLELGREEGLLDLLEEELSDRTIELGGDGLRLHADLHLRDAGLAVGLDSTGEQATERGLASTILSHHDNDLGVGELTTLDAEAELTERLLHLGVVEGARLVNGIVIGALSDAEGKRFVTETEVLGGDMAIEEDVDTFTDRVRQGNHTVDGRFTVQDANVVRKVVKDGQIVLNNNDVVVVPQQRSYNLGGTETLLHIEVGRRLVKHVHIGLLNADGTNSESLELSTRQLCNVTLQQVLQLQGLCDLVGIAERSAAVDEVANLLVCAADSLGDLVDVLGLDNSLEVVLEELGEVI